MELLSCIPKQPKSHKTLNWGTWGRRGCNSSLNSYYAEDSTMKKSSTMPSRLSNLSRSFSSAGSGNTSSSTSLLRHHLLPSNSERSKKTSRSDDVYNTLFSIPESEQTFEEYSACPLKRSRTLPASAIRRSGGSQKYSVDSSLKKGEHLSMEAPSLRSLKEKFKMETFCKSFRSRSFSRKGTISSIERIGSKDSLNRPGTAMSGPLRCQTAQSEQFDISRNSQKNREDACNSLVAYSISSVTAPGSSSPNPRREPIYNQPDNEKETYCVPIECSTIGQPVKSEPEGSPFNLYDIPLTLTRSTFDSGVAENEMDDSSSDISSVTISPLNETCVEMSRSPVSSRRSTEATSETNCEGIPMEVIERGKRHSLASSASDGSRLTFGTSTDEGFGSNFSETSSTLWSSSASTTTSPSSNRTPCRSDTYSAADESASLYSSLSSASSCISSIYGSELSNCKGAIPKRRFSSFRRCRGKGSHISDSADVPFKGTSCIDVTEEEEVCSHCSRDSDEQVHFNRSNSLRNPQQLPVTPTLLRILQLGLEQVGGVESSVLPQEVPNVNNGGVTRREKLHPPRTDPHRLSRANLEDSGDLELDAILHELCALESQFNFEIANIPSTTGPTTTTAPPTFQQQQQKSNFTPVSNIVANNTNNIGFSKMQPHPPVCQQQPQQVIQRPKSHTRTGSGGMKQKLDSLNMEAEVPQNTIARTDSPDNDSAFSDNVSMLSSESSASSGASGGGGLSSRQDTHRHIPSMDQAAKVKAEKIKMALEKLKEANVKKLFIKAFSQDGSSKSLLVDEKMTVAYVCRMLTDKNHVRVDPKWAIIEHLPDLYMERIYEDDEMLVDNLLLWARDSKNKLLFLERLDKYDLFLRPENYILYGSSSQPKASEIDDEARNNLIEEFFSSSSVPDVEGPLFLKSEGKKAWKKFYFVLRQSGLYYCPKGKSSRSSKDLVCLVTLEANQVYHGNGWKKKFKAPTDFGFAIKLPHLQTKSSKHIKYLCAEDANSLSQWVMGIRIAKHGQRLLDNYRSLVEDIAQEDIDMLASSRSFSLASVSASSRGHSEATTPSSESRSLDSCLAPSLTPSMLEELDDMEDNSSSAGSSSQDTPVNTLSRTPAYKHESRRSGSSSSSSGCLSERSSSGTPTGEHGFESEFPQQGTIKRKPSSNPKIPLTSTTRHLVKEADMDGCVAASTELSSRNSSLRLSTARKSLSEEVNTLRRRNSSQSRSSVTSNVSSNVLSGVTSAASSVPSVHDDEDEFDSLPLPPPPLDLSSLCDASLLPPPPPELMASTLSLNSLPPPPEEGSLPSFSEDLMTASMISLPPPSPPSPPSSCPSKLINSPPVTPPKPKIIFSSIYQSSPIATPPFQPTLASQYQSSMALTYQPIMNPSYKLATTPPFQQTVTPKQSAAASIYHPTMTPSYQHAMASVAYQPTNTPYQPPMTPPYQSVNAPYQSPVTPPVVAPKPIRRDSSSDGIYAIRGVLTSPTEQRPPSLPSTNGWQTHSPPPPPPLPSGHPIYAQPQKSPQKKVKRITFLDDVQHIPPAPSPPCPSSPSKPPPLPRRLQSTKLSLHPGKLDSPGCKVTPPKNFLNNLQRVMQKKWQVAQKCRDFDKTPHEVLGFRDPFPQREAEKNVGAWIQEHYGSLYENLSPNYVHQTGENSTNGASSEGIYSSNQYPVSSTPVPGEVAGQNRILQNMLLRKKAPPPPPKRADTTHLSGIQ